MVRRVGSGLEGGAIGVVTEVRFAVLDDSKLQLSNSRSHHRAGESSLGMTLASTDFWWVWTGEASWRLLRVGRWWR